MKRYRWFLAAWPFSIRSMAARLKSYAFNDDSVNGFVIDRVREDYLEARYVERVEYSDAIVDPFGRETIFSRVEYLQCDFKISTGQFGLELIDYPRSTQSMLSRLAEASDFKFSLSPVLVDVMCWAEEISKYPEITSIVDSVQIGSLILERGVVAKSIIRGEKDVTKAVFELTKGRSYTLDKVQIRLGGKCSGKVVLSSNGSAKVDVDQHDLVINILRSALPLGLRKTS